MFIYRIPSFGLIWCPLSEVLGPPAVACETAPKLKTTSPLSSSKGETFQKVPIYSNQTSDILSTLLHPGERN